MRWTDDNEWCGYAGCPETLEKSLRYKGTMCEKCVQHIAMWWTGLRKGLTLWIPTLNLIQLVEIISVSGIGRHASNDENKIGCVPESMHRLRMATISKDSHWEPKAPDRQSQIKQIDINTAQCATDSLPSLLWVWKFHLAFTEFCNSSLLLLGNKKVSQWLLCCFHRACDVDIHPKGPVMQNWWMVRREMRKEKPWILVDVLVDLSTLQHHFVTP